jgi:hypothetical protein
MEGFKEVDTANILGLTMGRSNPSRVTTLISLEICPDKLWDDGSLSGRKVDEACR